MSVYGLFEAVVVTLVVIFAAWRVWKTLAPKRKAKDAPGCDAGCPSCNHCVTDSTVSAPAGATPRPPKEAPMHFVPRRRS